MERRLNGESMDKEQSKRRVKRGGGVVQGAGLLAVVIPKALFCTQSFLIFT